MVVKAAFVCWSAALSRWGAPIKTGTMEGVQVPNREGLASHSGSESCASDSNAVREALTGDVQAQY